MPCSDGTASMCCRLYVRSKTAEDASVVFLSSLGGLTVPLLAADGDRARPYERLRDVHGRPVATDTGGRRLSGDAQSGQREQHTTAQRDASSYELPHD